MDIGVRSVMQAIQAYRLASKGAEEATSSVKKLNSALNGDTKKASVNISAYIDNISLLNMYLSDLAAVSERAGKNLSGIATADPKLGMLVELTEGLITSMGTVVGQLESMTKALNRVANSSESSNDRIKSLVKTTNLLRNSVIVGNGSLADMAEAAAKAGKSSDNAGQKTDKLNNRLRNLRGEGSQSARAFAKLAFGMNPLVATYAAVAVNVYALSEAFRILKDAASLERLMEQTAQFSASISGINVKALAEQMQLVSGGALAMGESIKQAVRGVSFNFMTEDLIRLTEGARKASVALGIDFTDAMDRVIRGISKGEVELLDELGVVTRLDTAYQKYAATMGLKADQLTDYQRKVALTTEVLGQLTSKYKAFDTAANNTERLGAATKNFVDVLSMQTAKRLDNVLGKIASFMEGLAPQATNAKKAAESLKIYNDALKAGNIDQAGVAWAEYTKYQELAVRETTKGTAEYEKLQEAMGKTKTAIEMTTNAMAGLVLWMSRGLIMSVVAGSAKVLYNVLGALIVRLMAGGTIMAALNAAFAAGAAVLAAIATPIGAVVLGIGALVAGAAALLKWLAPDVFAAAVNAAGDAVDWLGEKISDLLNWVGEAIGIKDFISDMAGIEKSANLAADSILRLENVRSNKRLVPTRQMEEAFSPGMPKTDPMEARLNFVQLTNKELAEQQATRDKEDIAYAAGLTEAVSAVKSLALELEVPKTKMEELAKKARNIFPNDEFVTLNTNTETWTKAKNFFDELQKAGYIAKSIDFADGMGLREFVTNTEQAAKGLKSMEENRRVLEEKFSTSVMGSRDEGIKQLEYQIKLDSQYLAQHSQLGNKINEAKKQELQQNILINQEKIKQAKLQNEILAIEQYYELQTESKVNALKLTGALESEILAAKIQQLELEIEAKARKGQDVEALRHKVDLMKEEYKYAKAQEAYARDRYAYEKALADQETKTGQSLNERERAANLQKELDIKRQQVRTDTQLTDLERERSLSELDREQKKLNMKKEAALYRDVSEAAAGIAGLEGLTDLQSQFASSVSDMSGTYATFLEEVGSDSMSFTKYLAGNVEAMTSMMQASVSLAGQVFKTMSDEKIAGIDREIEAEKRRDGKSAESLAKIKALEAKKIKEEAKAKKASVIMSTAAGVMQAFAQMGPFGAPFAAIIGAMGLMQLASIDRAANGQLAALNDGSSASMSIATGNRTNEVDVSKKANAGELAYLQGASGTGTANNFIPGKAVGGFARAGTSIVVGESGPETITPAMPVNVSPAGSGSSQPSIIFSPVLNAHAIDAQGMDELLNKYSREMFNSLERELNARNKTLDSL